MEDKRLAQGVQLERVTSLGLLSPSLKFCPSVHSWVCEMSLSCSQVGSVIQFSLKLFSVAAQKLQVILTTRISIFLLKSHASLLFVCF